MSFKMYKPDELLGTWTHLSNSKKLNESLNQLTFNEDSTFEQLIVLNEEFDQDTIFFEGRYSLKNEELRFTYGEIGDVSVYKLCKLNAKKMTLKFISKKGVPRKFVFVKSKELNTE
jgi:hypothetical protein